MYVCMYVCMCVYVCMCANMHVQVFTQYNLHKLAAKPLG